MHPVSCSLTARWLLAGCSRLQLGPVYDNQTHTVRHSSSLRLSVVRRVLPCATVCRGVARGRPSRRVRHDRRRRLTAGCLGCKGNSDHHFIHCSDYSDEATESLTADLPTDLLSMSCIYPVAALSASPDSSGPLLLLMMMLLMLLMLYAVTAIAACLLACSIRHARDLPSPSLPCASGLGLCLCLCLSLSSTSVPHVMSFCQDPHVRFPTWAVPLPCHTESKLHRPPLDSRPVAFVII